MDYQALLQREEGFEYFILTRDLVNLCMTDNGGLFDQTRCYYRQLEFDSRVLPLSVTTIHR